MASDRQVRKHARIHEELERTCFAFAENSGRQHWGYYKELVPQPWLALHCLVHRSFWPPRLGARDWDQLFGARSRLLVLHRALKLQSIRFSRTIALPVSKSIL